MFVMSQASDIDVENLESTENFQKLGKEKVFYIYMTHPAQLLCLLHLLDSCYILFNIKTYEDIKMCL